MADGRWIGIMASYCSISERLDGKSSTSEDPPFGVSLIRVIISMIHVFQCHLKMQNLLFLIICY